MGADSRGYPQIDYSICNQCQKCITLCPEQALLMNGVPPLPISVKETSAKKQYDAGKSRESDYDRLIRLLRRRRSVKAFRDRPVPRELLTKIIESAAFAPNQNKNIRLLTIDDPAIIAKIDRAAYTFVKRVYNVLFKFNLPFRFLGLFSGSLAVIKKKMEHDLFTKKQIVKTNTKSFIMTVGAPRVPVTESSAQYLLGIMHLTAESIGLGSTLMDSIKITVNSTRRLKKSLKIPTGERVLGVLAIGYSAEDSKNIARGYKVPHYWNRMGE